MKINRCKSLFCSFKQVLKNIKNCLISLNKNVIPEIAVRRTRESQPYVSSSRKVSVRDIGRFFIPRTTTLRGDGRGRALRGDGTSASGFTLLEVIVAIIIIGALLAFALPKYETALDKSRFSTLMPITRSIKDAEEIFYVASNEYTEDIRSLDVHANPSETVQVSVKADEYYSYVQAVDPRIDNIYKQYLKHSSNFPEERHCEALTESTRANKVCESLGGTLLDESGEYTVYVLEGSGQGTVNVERACEGDGPATERACPSGCGVQTRTNRCNTHTGEWVEGEWDESSCAAVPDSTTTEGCDDGKVKYREVACQGTAWTVGDWSECMTLHDGETCMAYINYCSYATYINGAHCSGSKSSSCQGSTYIDSTCFANNDAACAFSSYIHSSCTASYGKGSCNYSTFVNSSCSASSSPACSHSTFTRSTCTAHSADACSSGSFYENSRCYVKASTNKACTGTYDDTSCCVTSSGSCPAGTSCAEKGLPDEP